jgi:RNA polymerase sigma-B factor
MSSRSTPFARRTLRRPCAIERRNTLVTHHHGLVRPIALHYGRCCREASDDLIQAGMLGLIRAAELFDQRLGTPFPVFARPHIRGAILHHLRDVAPAVRLPRRQAELQEQLKKIERQGQQEGRPPHPALLQSRLGIDAGQWSLLIRHRQLERPCSLSELPAEILETAQLGSSPIDEPKAKEEIEPEGSSEEAGADLLRLLGRLESRQRKVVQQVVLGGVSYRELARSMQISPMTVQRLLHRGLEQLRQILEGEGFSSRLCSDRVPSVSPGC